MLMPFLALGKALMLYILWALVTFHTDTRVGKHIMVYRNPGTSHLWIAVLHVIVTCGPLFFSGYRYMIALGAANLVGVSLVILVKQYGFTSFWCACTATVRC